MAIPKSDTIAAIATPPGVGGIGIIRISGERALAVLRELFLPHRPLVSFQSHRLYYGTIQGSQGELLDEVLAVYMRAPHTYTTEDVVEIQSHGSFLVLRAILSAIFSLDVRPADPGEFTKRAFLGGRIDLTRAEAVADLLAAGTSSGMQLALGQMQGALFAEVEQARQEMIALLGVFEVAIDFPDDDAEIIDTSHLLQRLHGGVIAPLRHLLVCAEQGRVIREGVRAVIIGRPNVGKSSLLNVLLREERALVADIPGTTRDTLEELIQVKGIPVYLIDTAGIREHADQVEELGIARARQKMQEADLVLFVLDAARELRAEDLSLYETVREKPHIVVCNKMDMTTAERAAALSNHFPGQSIVYISTKRSSDIEVVIEAIHTEISQNAGQLDELPACAPNVRHCAVLEQAIAACRRLEDALLQGVPVDLMAVEAQSALDALGEIAGVSTTPDEVLDSIFSRFCIGK